MNSKKFQEWLDNVNSTFALRYRGMVVNAEEAWNKGMEEERNRTLEIIKNISLDVKSCIDPATAKTIIIIVLTRI